MSKMVKTDNKKHKTVGVVLLNWNGADLTIACIESLLCGILIPDHIIVVDNASSDGSADMIETKYQQVQIIRNTKNLGFAGGNNIGIQQLIKQDVDYIWVLNNDTEIDENCLDELVKFMDGEPNVSGCCGKILYDNPHDKIWYAGATLNNYTLKSKHRGEMETDKGQYNDPNTTPFITGCCMFVRKSAWECTGGFDEQFFAYSEDLDWCLRARNLGLTLRYVSQSIIYHKVSATFKKTTTQKNGGTSSPLAIYLITRNRMFLIRKHAKNGFQFLVSTILYFTWNFCYGTGLILLLRNTKFKALAKGIIDGCFNKLTPEVQMIDQTLKV